MTSSVLTRRRVARPSWGALVAAAVVALPAPAQFVDFVGPARGAWENPANWSPAGLPGASNAARISNNDDAVLTTTQTVNALYVGNTGDLEIGPGGNLTTTFATVFGSSLLRRSLLVNGGILTVTDPSLARLTIAGGMDAINGSTIETGELLVSGSDAFARFTDSALTVNTSLNFDATHSLSSPLGKLELTNSTANVRQGTLLYGIINLTGSTWQSADLQQRHAQITLSANSTMSVGNLFLGQAASGSIAVNSGSRLEFNQIVATATQLGNASFTLNDGTIATDGTSTNPLPISITGASTLDIGPGDLTQKGSLSGSTLTKAGTGFLNLDANSNPLTTVRIAAGTLQARSGSVLTPVTMILGPAVGDHGVFRLSAGGTLRMRGHDTLAVGAGTGELQIYGGTLDITGAFSTSVPMTAAGVSLIDTRDTTAALHGVISGTGELQKTGDGTLFLTANNTHAGGTTFYAGTVEFAAGGLGGRVRQLGGTLRWAAGNTQDISAGLEAVANGGILDFQDNDVLFAAPLVGLGNLTKAGAGTLTLGAAGNSSPALRVAQGAVRLASGATLTTFDLVLGANPGSPGAFEVGAGSTLNVGGTDGIRLGPGGGTFALAGGQIKVTNSSLTTAVDVTLSGGSAVDTSGVTASFSGVLSGNGSLTKTGGGTLRLTGNNTHTGGTINHAGDLQVDGSIGAVDVQPGARLTGTGRTGLITLESGALLAPGNGPGTLTAAALDWKPTATMQFDLGAGATDFLTLTGALSKQGPGAYYFFFHDQGWQEGHTYALINFGSTSFEATDFSVANPGGFSGDFLIEANHLYFTLTSVPEPGGWAAGISLFLLVVAAARRSRVAARG